MELPFQADLHFYSIYQGMSYLHVIFLVQSITAQIFLGSITAQIFLGSITAQIFLGSITAQIFLGSITAQIFLGKNSVVVVCYVLEMLGGRHFCSSTFPVTVKILML